jgi:hypothetical protein
LMVCWKVKMCIRKRKLRKHLLKEIDYFYFQI